jgi:hypothetical protein
MISSPALGNIIREGHTEKIDSYIQSGRSQGMITMDTTLRRYLDQKLITGEEAYMFSLDKSLFERYFSQDVPAEAPAKPKPEAPAAAAPDPAKSGLFKSGVLPALKPKSGEIKAPPPKPPSKEFTVPPSKGPVNEGWG